MAGKIIENFKKEKISVVLCTYNGELFLKEQIESILKQTHLPDEIIVCDDCSTDSTVEILIDFQKISPVPFKIYINEKNLGVSKNFDKAISLCNGNIIFLSDQDDIWMPEKIEKVIEVFNNNENCSYVFSDAYVVNKDLHPLGYTMWESISFGKRQRESFKKGRQLKVLLKHNVVTGSTMAFRSHIREIVLPIPEIWIHDAWISLLGSIVGRGGTLLESALIYYRQHDYQLIGGKKSGILDKVRKALSTSVADYILDVKRYEVLNGRVLDLLGSKNNKVEDKILFLKQRIKIYGSSVFLSLIIITYELFSGRYFKYSNNGLGSVAKDIFIVFKNLIGIRRKEK
jgi:glycosyltransferase involved in cell wall biosynthesis